MAAVIFGPELALPLAMVLVVALVIFLVVRLFVRRPPRAIELASIDEPPLAPAPTPQHKAREPLRWLVPSLLAALLVVGGTLGGLALADAHHSQHCSSYGSALAAVLTDPTTPASSADLARLDPTDAKMVRESRQNLSQALGKRYNSASALWESYNRWAQAEKASLLDAQGC